MAGAGNSAPWKCACFAQCLARPQNCSGLPSQHARFLACSPRCATPRYVTATRADHMSVYLAIDGPRCNALRRVAGTSPLPGAAASGQPVRLSASRASPPAGRLSCFCECTATLRCFTTWVGHADDTQQVCPNPSRVPAVDVSSKRRIEIGDSYRCERQRRRQHVSS